MIAKSKGMLYLALLSVIWGASFLLIKIAGQSFPPLALATGRMVIGAVCLFFFLKAQGGGMPRISRVWVPFLLLGIFNALIPIALLSFAETEISSGLTAVLNSTVPIITVILAHFLVDERLTTDKTIGIIIGFSGTLIVLIPNLSNGTSTSITGLIAVLLASLFIALSTIYARKYLKDVPPAQTATGMMASAAVVGFPLMLIFENPDQISPAGDDILALFALGIICSAVAYLLYYWLVANRGATYASLVMFTQPALALIFSAIFIDASVQWTTILGMAVILLCIAIMDGFLDRFFKSKKPSTA